MELSYKKSLNFEDIKLVIIPSHPVRTSLPLARIQIHRPEHVGESLDKGRVSLCYLTPYTSRKTLVW